MKKNSVLVCAAVPGLTLLVFLLSLESGAVGSALGALIVAVAGLVVSLLLLLAPVLKLLLLAALAFVVGGIIHMLREIENDPHPLVCASISAVCAAVLFYSVHPGFTVLSALLIALVLAGVSDGRRKGQKNGTGLVAVIVAVVLGMFWFLDSAFASKMEENALKAQAATAHLLSPPELESYDAKLRERFMDAPDGERPIRQWAMADGMSQTPGTHTSNAMSLAVPSLRDPLFCQVDGDGKVRMAVMRETSFITDAFLRRLCSLRIGNG